MSKRFVVVMLGVISAVGVTQLVGKYPEANVARANAAGGTTTLSARYRQFEDFGELADASELVIRGTVEDVKPSRRYTPRGVTREELTPTAGPDLRVVKTDLGVRVEQVIKGSRDLIDSTVLVSQLGGTDGGRTYVVEDYPLSEKGRSYVLFLAKDGEGNYAPMAGPQGHYLVSGGKLQNVSGAVATPFRHYVLTGLDVSVVEGNFDQVRGVASPLRETARAIPQPSPIPPLSDEQKRLNAEEKQRQLREKGIVAQ